MKSNRRGALLCLALLFFIFNGTYSMKFTFNSEPLPKDDPYKVLGIKFTATDAEIQQAYRKKAKETHRKFVLVCLLRAAEIVSF